MNKKFEQKLIREIYNIIENREVPGLSMGIVDKTGLVFSYELGSAHIEKQLPITKSTIYDLASLTKVIATLTSILILVENKQIKLTDPVSKFLSFKVFKDIQIQDLLHHTSGLPAFYPFYREKLSTKKDIIGKIASIAATRSQENTVIYSDLNFMLLGFIVEKVTNQNLEEFTRNDIFTPLQMHHTGFNPSKNWLDHIAATEYREENKAYDHGHVHDENANFLGGVAGHAGLFSTLDDLANFARMIVNPNDDRNSILKEETISLSIQNSVKRNVIRGLGWQFNDQRIIGSAFPPDSFGHTGFTGTSLWFDNHRQFAVILLTNRVHFGRDCNIAPVRKRLHTLAYDYYINQK